MKRRRAEQCQALSEGTQIVYVHACRESFCPAHRCLPIHVDNQKMKSQSGFYIMRLCRYAPFYLRNSNAQVKSECDYIDEDIGVKSGLGSLAGLIEEVCSETGARKTRGTRRV